MNFQSATLLKEIPQHMYFPVNFARFLRTPFSKKRSEPSSVSRYYIKDINMASSDNFASHHPEQIPKIFDIFKCF